MHLSRLNTIKLSLDKMYVLLKLVPIKQFCQELFIFINLF